MLNENKDKLKELTIPFAIVNNKVKSITNITKFDEAYCLQCGEKLMLKNGDVKIKHLAHYSNSNCIYKDEREYKHRGNGESYEHKYAKEFLKDNLTYFRQYGNQIIIKDGEFKLGGYTDLKINSIEMEYRGLQDELKLERAYIPDILIRTDNTLIALEIYKSNKKDVGDITELLIGKNISVYEIDINNVNLTNINTVFKNMKLIFSDLKVEYDNAIQIFQKILIQRNNLQWSILSLEGDIIRLESINNQLTTENKKLKSEKGKPKNGYISEIEYLKRKIKTMDKTIGDYCFKEIENKKCWTKCVKDWYSNEINSIINYHIKLYDSNSIEYNLLMKFKNHYNGKVGIYGSRGGDDRLKYIADIGRKFKEALKYLGNDNDKFIEVLNQD